MNNAFARMGWTCASIALAGGLSAVAMFGASNTQVSITIPHAVAVGNTTLPTGNYTITGIELGDGNQLFVVRPDHGSPVTLQARRVTGEVSDNTRVEFSTAGDAWHFQKLSIHGDSTGYEFLDTDTASEEK